MIKLSYLVIYSPPTQNNSFFRNLPPLFGCNTKLSTYHSSYLTLIASTVQRYKRWKLLRTSSVSSPTRLNWIAGVIQLLLRKVVDDEINVYLSSDYRLVGHVIEFLLTDELDCGLRCVRNEKCQSYNCFSDQHHGKKTCQLNDQTRHSKPTDFRANKGFTYYGKGRKKTTAMP